MPQRRRIYANEITVGILILPYLFLSQRQPGSQLELYSSVSSVVVFAGRLNANKDVI